MKIVVVGNLAKRTEIKGRKKETILAGGSYFAAIQAAKLGHDVTLVTKMSSNFLKEWLKKIKSYGIKLYKLPSWEDTSYEVEYHKDGTKTAVVFSDAGPIMSIPKMECDIALITSYIGHVGLNVLKNLKTEENLLVLDAQGYTKYKNPAGELYYVPWLEKEEYLEYVDILKFNVAELYYLTGKTTLASAESLLRLGPKIVILTVGQKGSYIFYDKKHAKIPIYEETKFVDKVGVGDVYTMAFAIKYKETNDPIEAAYFATAAASLCVEDYAEKGIGDLKKVNKRFKILKNIFLV